MRKIQIKFFFRKAAALMLASVMLLSAGAVFAVSGGSFTADAAEDSIYSRLLAVKAVYPDQYFYFTVSGNACKSNQTDDCRLSLIPSRGGLPAGKKAALWEGWSCVGFARYVFYYVFGENFSTALQVSTPSVGDVIHTTGPRSNHCSVYLGEDDDYWYVFDANWGNNCGVRWEGKIAKSKHTLHEIYHAKSYDKLPLGSIPKESCGDTDNAHTWQKGTVVLNPTCEVEGEQIYTCTVCGATKLEPIPFAEHAWNKGKDNGKGAVIYTCTVCGETKEEPAAGALTQTGSDIEIGDVDKDGAITANDARLALRYALQDDRIEEDGEIFLLCDIDGDKLVTSADARIILRLSVGLTAD